MGRQLKSPSGPIGKRPFWGKSWPGGLLEANFCHLRARGPAIKIPFWDHWETAVLGQILAGSLLEANFGNWRARGPAIKIPFWAHWETALLGQILAGGLLEANFYHLRARGPAIKIPFWDHWETALWAKFWSGSFLEAWRELVKAVRLLYQAEGRSKTKRGKPKGRKTSQMTWDQGRVG